MALFGMLILLAGLLYLSCAFANVSVLGSLMPLNGSRDRLIWGSLGFVAFAFGAVIVLNVM